MKTRLPLALGIAWFVLIGCGGGDGDGAAPDDDMSTPPEDAMAEPPPFDDAMAIADMAPRNRPIPAPQMDGMVIIEETAPAADGAAPIEDTSAPAVDTALPADTSVPAEDTSVPPEDTRPPEEGVPANGPALFAWLRAGKYKSWAHESAPHKSAGPHGNPVLTWVNDTLETSLRDGEAVHPRGSAAVKELYSGSEVHGWAVSIKVESDSNGGKGWFWYEVFSTTDSSNAIAARGYVGCTSCHVLGRDYFRSPYPLQ